MKLLFIVGFYPEIIGGAEYQARIIAQELVQNYNHEIIFASYGHSYDETSVRDGFKIYRLSIKTHIVERIALYRDLCDRIRKIVDMERPDLVYQRVLNTYTFRISASCLKFNIPFIVHVSDKYSVVFNNSLRSFFKKLMLKQIIRNKSKIIVQTTDQAKLLNDIGLKPDLQLYNFHPVSSVINKKSSTNRNILWIGSVRPVKRAELFLDLVEACKVKPELKFKLIGRIEQSAYGNRIHKRILTLTNLEYLGEVDNSEINRILSADAFCIINTSLSEGFSNTFIQAWQRGIPVISLCSDPDNIIDKYKLGLNCESSMEKLIANLNILISNNDLYNEISSNAIDFSRQLFSIESNISRFENFIQNVFYNRK